MVIALLIILNIPVFLFLGWLAFDTKDNAADTFFETIVSIIKAILLPRMVRVLIGDDDDDAAGILTVLGFLTACALVVYGEYHLLTKYGWL